jgi:DNA-binding transcriptional regulator WhiA
MYRRGKNASSDLQPIGETVNQQGSPLFDFFEYDPSETTRRTPLSQGEIKAYLQGALHDATFSSNCRFRFSQKGTEWLLVMKQLLKRVGYNSWIYREGKTREVYVLETLANFLDFSFDPLTLKSKKEKVSYLRGFFDAEGGIPHNQNARFYIQLVQKDKQKIFSIKEMLAELGIRTGKIHNPSKRIDPNYWRIFVLAESQLDFVKIIGTWHPRKIKLLEKRMMI